MILEGVPLWIRLPLGLVVVVAFASVLWRMR